MLDDWLDSELLRRSDVAAWEDFYQANCQRTYRVLHCITSAERNILEELNQDVWLSAIESIRSFDSERGSVRDWILGIARFKGLTYLRQRYRRQAMYATSAEAASTQTLDQMMATQQDCDVAERLAMLRACLASLPEKWQFVLVQKYELGQSVNSIAALCDASPKAIESMLSRARQRLRDLLTEMLENEGASRNHE